jgi:chromosome segregation ATPase
MAKEAANNSLRPSGGGAPGWKPSYVLDYTSGEAQTSPPTTQLDSLLEFVPEKPAGPIADRAPIDPNRLAPRVPSISAATEHQPAWRAGMTGLEDLRARLRQTDLAIEESKSNVDAVSVNVIELRNSAVQLAERYSSLEGTCRQTELRNADAIETLDDIEGRLGPLEIVRDLTNRTDAGLASLNQLAEEVAQRAAHLQGQRESVDQAIARISQANALLVALEGRVAALTADDALQDAEAAVDHLGRRAAEITTNLERRASETTANLDARLDRFAGQKDSIEQALTQAARATDLAAGVDAHLEMLAGPGQALAKAEAKITDLQRQAAETTAELERYADDLITRVGRRAAETTTDLEQRAAGTTSDLERRIDGFDAQKQAVVQALDDVERVSDRLTAFDARLAALAAPHQALAQAEAKVEQLHSRAVATTASVEQRTVESAVNVERRASEAIDALERRAAETTSDLDRRIASFDAEKQGIEEALANAARAVSLVADLEAHVAALTAPDRALAQAETRVEWLRHRAVEATAAQEQRAVEATAAQEQRAIEALANLESRAAETRTDLERQLEAFEVQKKRIGQTLAEAARVTDLVAALDNHVAALIRPDQSLSHAQATVEELERRVAATAIRLEQLARGNAHLERAVATTERHQSTVGAVSSGMRAATPFWPFATGLAALVASAVLAIVVSRDPGPPAETSNIARLPEPQSAGTATRLPQEPKALPEMSLPPVSAPAAGPVGASPPAVSSSPPAVQPGSSQQAAPAPLPAVSPGKQRTSPAGRQTRQTGQPSRASGAAAKPARTTASMAPAAPATGVKRFVAVLAVDSLPMGAAVFVDQRHVGQTPVQVPDLRAGTHAIRIEQEGYVRWTTAVSVPAGEQTRVSARLQPVKGSSTVGR